MPRQWNKLLLALCGVAGVVAIYLFCMREVEPSYDGRALSEWVAILNSTNSVEEVARARQAVGHIGTNGIPFLLRWCNYEPSRFNQTVWMLLPNSIGHTKRAEHLLYPSRAYERVENATRAFEALGPVAVSAIPELKKRVMASNDSVPRMHAFQALGGIGLPAAPVLLERVSDFDPDWAIVAVTALGTNAYLAVPMLKEKCTNGDVVVRRRATNLIGLCERLSGERRTK